MISQADTLICFISGVLLGGFSMFLLMCIFADRLISKMPSYKPPRYRSNDPADYWKYGRSNPFYFNEEEDEEDEEEFD